MDRLTPSDIKDSKSSTRMTNTIPMQRLGKKRDISNSCMFVASEAASYITGITYLVDGGSYLTMANFPFGSEEIVKNYPNFGKSKL